MKRRANVARLDNLFTGLSGLVPDCRPDFVGQFRGNFADLMNRASMLCGLLQDVLFGLATSDEVTVSNHIVTAQYLGHRGTSFIPISVEVYHSQPRSYSLRSDLKHRPKATRAAVSRRAVEVAGAIRDQAGGWGEPILAVVVEVV
jgi:hypothetical protein